MIYFIFISDDCKNKKVLLDMLLIFIFMINELSFFSFSLSLARSLASKRALKKNKYILLLFYIIQFQTTIKENSKWDFYLS